MTLLREALESDLDAIMRLETSTFVSDAWSRAMMRDELRSRHTRYLVAESAEGALIGYGGVSAPIGAGDADIQTLAVDAVARRAGVGRALLGALLDVARERGAERVFLEVRADNPIAQALYESVGFAPIGVRRGYYQPDGVDAVVMRLLLVASEEAS